MIEDAALTAKYSANWSAHNEDSNDVSESRKTGLLVCPVLVFHLVSAAVTYFYEETDYIIGCGFGAI